MRIFYPVSRSGGIGRRAGFKIQWWQHRAGSIPAFGTKRAGLRLGRFLAQDTQTANSRVCALTLEGRCKPLLERFAPRMLYAEVAELVDAHVSGACTLASVRVRLPPSALKAYRKPENILFIIPELLPKWRNW